MFLISANKRFHSFNYGKLLDNIVLSHSGDSMFSSELQFRFKAKGSTSLCSMVLK